MSVEADCMRATLVLPSPYKEAMMVRSNVGA